MTRRLYEYQQDIVSRITQPGNWGVFVPMGRGKTAIALHAVRHLLDSQTVSRGLVLSTPLIVSETWPDELEKWPALSLSWTVLSGPPKKREAQLGEDSGLTLCSVSLLPWLVSVLKTWPYDLVVLDESTLFKSFSAATRFKTLKPLLPQIKKILLLSGTPLENDYQDLWTQFYCLDGGKLLEKNITRYRRRYFYPDADRHTWTLHRGAAGTINKAIASSGLALSMPAPAGLPPLTVWDIPAPLPAPLQAKYNQFKKDQVVQLGANKLTAVSRGVLANRLHQFVHGGMYLPTGEVSVVHRARLGVLRRVINWCQTLGQSALIVYRWRYDYHWISHQYPQIKHITQDQDAVTLWNAGRLPLLAISQGCAGLNLQHGGHVLIWYGLPWSAATYSQTIDRLHRPGQTHPVTVIRIISPRTIDARIITVLRGRVSARQAQLDELGLTTQPRSV